jgi:hypothetical protein
LDNLSKAILDSLQGVVFENDAQIDVLVATKTVDAVTKMRRFKSKDTSYYSKKTNYD